MKQVQTLCITAQQKAYVERRKVYVSIQDFILVDEVEYGIPKDIACDSVSFTTMPKGICQRLSLFIVQTQIRRRSLSFK